MAQAELPQAEILLSHAKSSMDLTPLLPPDPQNIKATQKAYLERFKLLVSVSDISDNIPTQARDILCKIEELPSQTARAVLEITAIAGYDRSETGIHFRPDRSE